MVFVNHIKCYSLVRLFIVSGKWSYKVSSKLNVLRIYGTVRPKGNMCKWYVETVFLVKLEAE